MTWLFGNTDDVVTNLFSLTFLCTIICLAPLTLFYLKLVLFDFISIGERVLSLSFLLWHFLFLYKNVKENKKVCISVNFVIWFEVFSDKECTAWYRYYQWCWFMSLCSAFGIVLFQDLTIFFSGNKSDYHFFCLTPKILLVTFPSSFDIAFMLWIRLFFTRLISIVHYCWQSSNSCMLVNHLCTCGLNAMVCLWPWNNDPSLHFYCVTTAFWGPNSIESAASLFNVTLFL